MPTTSNANGHIAKCVRRKIKKNKGTNTHLFLINLKN